MGLPMVRGEERGPWGGALATGDIATGPCVLSGPRPEEPKQNAHTLEAPVSEVT